MKSVLFLTTELQRPVGGLFRFVIELLPAWRNLIQHGDTAYEPIAISLKDPLAPTGDLVLSHEFDELMHYNPKIKVFEAVRGGEKCFFVEYAQTDDERNEFHKMLWDKYRIKSEKVAHWDFYQKLNAYWAAMPLVAEFIARRKEVALVDAQDWLAMPAGFLIKEKLGIPLSVRFHSGEYGRALGKPDFESAPALIERAALQEADFVHGVSLSEAKFEIYNLLPHKQALNALVGGEKTDAWWREQKWKDERYQEFLFLESETPELITQNVAGVPNGIILDSWKAVTPEQIEKGKATLTKLLPGKKKSILFIGRAEWRKGIHHLLEAYAQLADPTVGLLILSSLSSAEGDAYRQKVRSLGIENQVQMYDGWVDEELKKGLFCTTDVICLPSIYEPFGLVTLEGLAADLACEKNGYTGPTVVVGDTGGMHEVIKNGVNGFKVPMEEDNFDLKPEYLASILKLVLNNDNLRKTTSKGGASRVQDDVFDWHHVAKNIFTEYDRSCENYAFFKTGANPEHPSKGKRLK